jgi:hypothetical protein
MKRALSILFSCLIVLMAANSASAQTQFNVAVSVGPSLPIGDFKETTDIITPNEEGGYDAGGGGAETGFGFNIELEVRAASRIFVGGRFGYSRLGANADDLMKSLMTGDSGGLMRSEMDEEEMSITGIEANWTLTTLGAYVRIVALDTPRLDLYGRFGMGTTKMKNAFDVTVEVPSFGTQTLTSEFDLGDQFLFAGTVGLEYAVSQRAYLFGELKISHMMSDGAEATASLSTYSIKGTQRYEADVLDVMVGLRIPLSGI